MVDKKTMTDNALAIMGQGEMLLDQHRQAEEARLAERAQALNKTGVTARETVYKGEAIPSRGVVDG